MRPTRTDSERPGSWKLRRTSSMRLADGSAARTEAESLVERARSRPKRWRSSERSAGSDCTRERVDAEVLAVELRRSTSTPRLRESLARPRSSAEEAREPGTARLSDAGRLVAGRWDRAELRSLRPACGVAGLAAAEVRDVGRDEALRELGRADGAGRAPCGRDGAGREADCRPADGALGAGRAAAGRDGAGRDAAGRDGAGREAAGREAAGRDDEGRPPEGRPPPPEGDGRDCAKAVPEQRRSTTMTRRNAEDPRAVLCAAEPPGHDAGTDRPGLSPRRSSSELFTGPSFARPGGERARALRRGAHDPSTPGATHRPTSPRSPRGRERFRAGG